MIEWYFIPSGSAPQALFALVAVAVALAAVVLMIGELFSTMFGDW